ncbi:MAG: NUDIX hydrolase [Propionibacteriaceae bacterium]|nr:NUDIX hydrolase [Propionibacteriaceae bacterium]
MNMITCARGCRHFGAHGAAGVLLTSQQRVLLQLRANSHHAGTWSTPGGSLEPGESPWTAAVREVHEELIGVPAALPAELAHVSDHGGWAYRTFVVRLEHPVPIAPRNAESERVDWVDLAAVDRLPLHPGFAAAWPELHTRLRAPLAA